MILTLYMRIHAISDTHNRHKEFTLKGGDVLIHSGDATGRGSLPEVIAFLDWFSQQKYTHKIFVPGNHDWAFEHNPELMEAECNTRNIILLNDSGVTIDCVKIWGSPVQPWFHDWAFNRHRGSEIKMHWDLIPKDTQVLITHGPPAGILDYAPRGGSVGCYDLLEAINKSDVKLHIFGHIHGARGHMKLGDKLFVNASSLDEQYQPVRGVPWQIGSLKDGTFAVIERRKKHEPKQEE